jgi:hypothetical protein
MRPERRLRRCKRLGHYKKCSIFALRPKGNQTFGSLQEMLHFCITTKGEPKMDHSHGTLVEDRIGEVKCVFQTHFDLLGTHWRQP